MRVFFCCDQLVARALGGETGPCARGWGTGPRCTPLADKDADQFLMACVRDYEEWQEAVAIAAEKEEDSKRAPLLLLPAEERTNKEALHFFYSHQDQVMHPPSKGGLR